jgi:tRNA(Ile)-lysidine synthase
MASSRKSRSLSKPFDIESAFERALGDILARVRAFGRDADRIAIAYSGGLDSGVLLHLASRYGKRSGLEIIACHVHHGLSPNADTWVAHCEAETLRCNVTLLSRRIDVPTGSGRGVEEAARIARYSALAQMCREAGARLLLTAHHQDDQAETVLLQLARGAGLPGLSGMATLQHAHALLGNGLAIGRPLLGMSRTQLELAAHEAGLDAVHDESNADLRYRRNAIRHAVVPALDAHFPGFAAAASRSATHIQAAQSLLADLAALDLAQCGGDWDAPLRISGLAALPERRADNLLRHWLQHQGIRLPSSARLEEIRKQMLTSAEDAQPEVDLGERILRRSGAVLAIHAKRAAAPDFDILLRWNGEAEIALPQWHGTLLLMQGEGAGIPAGSLREHGLCLRPRRGSERLKLSLTRPSRGLKQLYQDAGIPPWTRLWSPLAYLDEQLVFVAGLGMDARHVAPQGIMLRWREDTRA